MPYAIFENDSEHNTKVEIAEVTRFETAKSLCEMLDKDSDKQFFYTYEAMDESTNVT